jgi:PTH1 family peptidyl-tRNA hydrolase
VKLIAGLGNPGEKYRGTRHNVGFEVVDLVARRHGVVFEAAPADEALQGRWRRDSDVIVLLKPLTFMNVSGGPIAGLARYYKIATADVLIVADDVNLPLGRLRARSSGSEGGHNGLRSVAESFGTTTYARLRVGVGRGDVRRDLADHVLSRFDADEWTGISSAIARAADAVETWVDHGMDDVMNVYNRADE